MTTVDLPPYDIDLVPELVLQAPAPPPVLKGRISLGQPVVRPLTPTQAAEGNEEWVEFLESQAGTYDFVLLSLVCTFRPSDESPFGAAAVGIRLEAPGEQPIAWSISPKRRSVPVKASTQLKLTAKLMFVEAGVEYAPPQDGREKLFVVGMGEHDSDPEWRFNATDASPLVGDETLALIVRVPAGAPARAEIMMSASVKQRRLGLIPYRAELPAAVRTIHLRSGGAMLTGTPDQT